MKQTLVWVLSWSVLGPVPGGGELAKFTSKEECQQALVQKREEYKEKKQKIVAVCNLSSKNL